jgi:integrase
MLTDAKVKAAKPAAKPYKLHDERGLHVLVSPTGSKSWRFKYRIHGREKLLGLGLYPDVPLALARERRDDARREVAKGIDPSAKRKAEKAAQSDTLEAVTREYLDGLEKADDDGEDAKVDAGTVQRMRRRFEMYIFPRLGKRPIGTITPPDLLAELRRIEATGSRETAHRTRSAVGRVFRFAIATGRAERDIAADLVDALKPSNSRNFACITDPRRFGELLRAIHAYKGEPTTMAALKLAPLVFVRPAELRAAEWAEFDLAQTIRVDKYTVPAPEWRVPAGRMKQGERHIVPLATQAVAILDELRPFTGGGRFLFPSTRDPRTRFMSENTMNAALVRLGFLPAEHVVHGFRGTASTLLNERGFNGDVIERQLAHKPRNKVRASYNHAELLAERRALMQAWADYCDELRVGGTVAAIKPKRRARG